jgi:hypothetical protein
MSERRAVSREPAPQVLPHVSRRVPKPIRSSFERESDNTNVAQFIKDVIEMGIAAGGEGVGNAFLEQVHRNNDFPKRHPQPGELLSCLKRVGGKSVDITREQVIHRQFEFSAENLYKIVV